MNSFEINLNLIELAKLDQKSAKFDWKWNCKFQNWWNWTKKSAKFHKIWLKMKNWNSNCWNWTKISQIRLKMKLQVPKLVKFDQIWLKLKNWNSNCWNWTKISQIWLNLIEMETNKFSQIQMTFQVSKLAKLHQKISKIWLNLMEFDWKWRQNNSVKFKWNFKFFEFENWQNWSKKSKIQNGRLTN